MKVIDIQRAIAARCIDCEIQYNTTSFYVSVTLFYPDGTETEFEAKRGELFEIDDEARAVLIKIQCRFNPTYRTREYYHISR